LKIPKAGNIPEVTLLTSEQEGDMHKPVLPFLASRFQLLDKSHQRQGIESFQKHSCVELQDRYKTNHLKIPDPFEADC